MQQRHAQADPFGSRFGNCELPGPQPVRDTPSTSTALHHLPSFSTPPILVPDTHIYAGSPIYFVRVGWNLLRQCALQKFGATFVAAAELRRFELTSYRSGLVHSQLNHIDTMRHVLSTTKAALKLPD